MFDSPPPLSPAGLSSVPLSWDGSSRRDVLLGGWVWAMLAGRRAVVVGWV